MNGKITAELKTEFAEIHKLKILVVDDVKANLLVVSSLLKRMGYRATCVNGGKEALELLSDEPFDLIFMDIRMPCMDGIETTRRIRHQELQCCNYAKPVRIIALTADLMHATEGKCRDAGMDDYIAKPLKLDKLVDSLEKHHIDITQSN